MTYGARFPNLPGHECLFGPFVGLKLFRVFAASLHIAQCQVVHKRSVTVVFHVTPDVGEFVQQAEPKIVDAVVAQREADHWRAVAKLERRPIQYVFGR